MDKTLLEDQDKEKYQNQEKIQDKHKGRTEDINNYQLEEINKDNQDLPKEWISTRDHPIQNVIGDISNGVTT